MKISVVTISFNQASYIRNCIDSVLRQDYGNIEYIVVDAGSTDGSREIINSYAESIDIRVFEADRGPADGLNKGFSRASGDLLCYVNADDALVSDAVSAAVAKFEDMPHADVILGSGILVDREGHVLKSIHSTGWTSYSYAMGAAIAVQQSTFFRSACFAAVGGFNDTNHTCWDGEFLLDIALAGFNVVHVSEYFGVFRMYAESITGSQRFAKEYHADRARIAQKALGRDVGGMDRVLAWGIRAKNRFARVMTHGGGRLQRGAPWERVNAKRSKRV